MKLVEYSDRAGMMAALAALLAGLLREALAHSDRVGLAVPGGTTPGPIFDALSRSDLDWARVTALLTDERWVPETSERSN
ncbi:MAG: 6-phosphogluconolactonase, partial [Pseudomonadota bacterium]